MTPKELDIKLRTIQRCCRANACDIDAINEELTDIQIVLDDHEDRIIILEGGPGVVSLIPVENYSALPDPTTVPGQFYFVKNAQGTDWLPGSWGGTYYKAGIYYSDGVEWFTDVDPWQADQADVDAGIVNNQFVTPNTLANATTVSHPGHTHVVADITDYVPSSDTNLANTNLVLTGDRYHDLNNFVLEFYGIGLGAAYRWVVENGVTNLSQFDLNPDQVYLYNQDLADIARVLLENGELRFNSTLGIYMLETTPVTDNTATIALGYNSTTDRIVSMTKYTVSDAVHGVGWNGVTNVAPSQNAVFDVLATKSDVGHTHLASDITDFSTEFDANLALKDTDDLAEGATNKYLSAIEKTDLTDGNDTTLHHHDSRYYTESEVDSLLAAKSDDPHTHVATDVTDFVSEARVAVVTNGINNGVIDKSPSEDAVFDALALKAASIHTHVAADVTDFVTEARTAVVTNGINNGVTNKAPSEDAVFDALAGKAASSHTHTTSDISDIANTKLDIFGLTISEGAVVTTGIKGRLIIPYAGTITGWTILEVSSTPISGNIVIDVKLGTYANYDTTPTFTSIAGSEKPTLTGAVANRDLTLTTWTTAVAVGDIIEFTVDSASTVEKIYVAIHTTRT